jgi:hypothetical protein
MHLLERIRLKLHKKPRLTESQESISTPLGHVPYRRSFVVKSQPWTPSVSARNARWEDEREANDE